MRRFKSPGHAQRFLAAFGPIASLSWLLIHPPSPLAEIYYADRPWRG